jgi:Ni/Fe-hydrogenase subunit HybB-like protein
MAFFQGGLMKRQVFPVRALTAGQKDGGLSFLEIMFTIAILSVAALTATLLLVPVARQTGLRREVQTANLSAKKVLEKIQATPFTQIVTTYPQSYVETIPGLPSGGITITYADPTADPLLIQVGLAWTNAQAGTIQRTFDTVRTR